jgi:hypothetical protein
VMEQHVDFAALAAEVDLAAPRPSRERGGRPPFPTELMVRVLLIQQLFNLSDEQMEFQLLDRLSFQRFVGLRASSQRGGSGNSDSWIRGGLASLIRLGFSDHVQREFSAFFKPCCRPARPTAWANSAGDWPLRVM